MEAEGLIDIPAEETPSFTRGSYLRAPDWRYQAAISYLADQDAGRVPQIPTDPVVQLAARALRAFRKPGGREAVRQCWDAVYEAISLGTTYSDSAIATEVETLLIHGAGEDDPEVLVLPFRPEVYTLYAKLFFDLSGIKAIHSWMQDYLFAPETDRSSFRTKLRARLLAYYGDREASRGSVVLGRASANAMSLMKSMMSSERQRKLFDFVMHRAHIDETNYALLMEAALKDMTSREFAEHMKDREDAGSGTFEDIAAGLEAGIRAFSQNELESAASSTGLDFVNQYTNSILRKENGKEDLKDG